MLTKEENETLKLKVGPETKTHDVIYKKKKKNGMDKFKVTIKNVTPLSE